MRLPTLILCSLIVIVINSEKAWSNTSLPYEFNSQVPVYTSSQPVETRYTRDSVTVSFATQDAFDRVMLFYTQELNNSGWEVSSSNTGKSLIATNNEIELTLTEKNDFNGFTIVLFYRGGRE